jgi:hypothetical protein
MAKKTVVRFDGNSIQSSSYRAAVVSLSAPNAKNVYLEQAQADAQDSGAYTVDVRTIALVIEVKDYANRYTLQDQLQVWFKRGTRGNLEATFHDDGLDYLLPCTVTNIMQDKDFPQFWTVVLQTGESTWRAVTASTDTWEPSGTSGTKAITVGGKSDTKLSLTITPTVGPTSGYLKRQLYQLVNVPAVDYGLRPWCLTVDTLALVAQAAHKCLINNGAGIDASQTTIPYDTVTGTVPSVGVGYCGTEQISWTGRTGTTSGNLTGVARGINGTTAATHADNAEIKVSLVQADLNDYRVWLGDVETKRWIDSPASATSKIWFNAFLKPGFDLTLATAVANSGTPTYLQFAVDTTHKAKIKAMPSSGIVYHGNEWFAYSSKSDTLCRLYLSKREYLGTAIEAHNAAVVFKYIGTPITITYGNMSVGNPASDDDHYDDDKPVFDLNLSDNEKWIYSASSVFHDPLLPDRPGSWQPFMKKLGNETENYNFTENGESGAPVIGTEVGTWLSGSTYKAENVTGGFQFTSPGGIWKSTNSGKKLRSGTRWASKAGLQKSTAGTKWVDANAEATPAAAGAYTTFTHTDTVITATTITALANMNKSLRFGIFGSYAVEGDAYMRIETSGQTINFVSATIPSGTFLTATDNITMDVIIANAESGDSVRVVTPMLVGKEFAINGESNLVTFDGANSYGAITLNDNSRTEILRLETGVNNLSITSADMGTLALALSWYVRRM